MPLTNAHVQALVASYLHGQAAVSLPFGSGVGMGAEQVARELKCKDIDARAGVDVVLVYWHGTGFTHELLRLLPAFAAAHWYLDRHTLAQLETAAVLCRESVRRAAATVSSIKDDEERAVTLALLSEPLLNGWYPIEHEWCVVPGLPNRGVGDMVFRHPCGLDAVVEVKWLDHQASGHTASVRRWHKRKVMKEQALRYASTWADRTRRPTLACTYTNGRLMGAAGELECWEHASSGAAYAVADDACLHIVGRLLLEQLAKLHSSPASFQGVTQPPVPVLPQAPDHPMELATECCSVQ